MQLNFPVQKSPIKHSLPCCPGRRTRLSYETPSLIVSESHRWSDIHRLHLVSCSYLTKASLERLAIEPFQHLTSLSLERSEWIGGADLLRMVLPIIAFFFQSSFSSACGVGPNCGVDTKHKYRTTVNQLQPRPNATTEHKQ